MFGLSSFRSSVASRSNVASAVLSRALSTTESLKVSSPTSTPPPAAAQEERIKYFKVYRWDPDHRQKPVSAFIFLDLLAGNRSSKNNESSSPFAVHKLSMIPIICSTCPPTP